MKQAVILLSMPFLLVACGRDAPEPTDVRQVRTIEQEHAMNPRSGDAPGSGESAPRTDEPVELPFKPWISMDPVDGSKVSVRRTTPSTEHQGRIYHFSSQANLDLFLQDPMKYISGSLGRY